MDDLRNVIKASLALIIVLVLISTAFVVGFAVAKERVNGEGRDPGAVQTSVPHAQTEPTGTAESLPVDTTVPTVPSEGEPSAAPPETQQPVPEEPLPEVTLPPASTAEPEPGGVPELREDAAPDLTEEEAMQVLMEVWDLVEEEYYGELPPPEERVYGAIRGMLNTLDDEYTSFAEPSIAEIWRANASGSFEGVGALVTMNDDNILEIVETYQDSPADRAGLRAGDLVLAVDGESIIDYGIYEAIALIRGPEGSEVELTIKRGEAEPFSVRITRARLDIRIVESEMLEDSIGYVSLFDFSSKATATLQEALQALLDQGARALIFDLRGNPGGFLPQAVQVADLFLDEGMVLIERRSDGQVIEYTSTDEGLAQEIPLVVLVNPGSASASEIVAGAIQDRERGVLIGETTFGKGSVQLLHTLSDGSELRVTVARWFTPNDRAIHGEGLAPNIEVPLTAEDREAERDPQLERAIEYLETGQ